MSLLAQLQAAGLPILSVTIDELTTQGETGPHQPRNAGELTTGEQTQVTTFSAEWASGPTAIQVDTLHAIVGGAMRLVNAVIAPPTSAFTSEFTGEFI